MKRPLVHLVWFLLLSPAAFAQSDPGPDAAGWRVGLVAHNIRFERGEHQSNENGPNLEIEIDSARPHNLAWLGHPQFYGELSANLNGDTSFAAAGLYWRWKLGHRWRIEPGFGLAIHDGKLHDPYPASDPRSIDFEREHQLLGTRLLFRDSLALERQIGGGRSIGLVFEHLSNGGEVFGHRDNGSLNELGLRYTMRFR